MSTNVAWNGSTYAVPATGEENWGGTTKVDGLLIALATHGFQKTGGLFTLSADADFGASFGLKAVYFKSRGTVADAGILRLAKTESIAWRNNADSGNNTLATDTSDRLLYNGVVVLSSTGVVAVAAGGTGLTSYTTGDLLYASGSTTIAKLGIGTSNKVLTSTGSAPAWSSIVNANVDAAAAIAYSKLALTGSIVNADVNASAAIAYSKLALTGSIVNADINASAAIAVTKLALTAAITAAMLNSGAASSGDVYTADGAGGGSYAAQAAAPNQSHELTNLGLSASVATNALTIALKQKDGSTDPGAGTAAVKIGFRDATAANGDFVQRTVTGALSVVIPSGTTIGAKNAQQNVIYVYALDNAGTVELAVSLKRFDEGSVQTSTSISGGATETTLYSTTGRSSKSIRLIGRVTATEATAGTWATSPSEVSVIPFASVFIPTVQKFTSGTAQTYTTPTGARWLRIIMVGPGGGGGGGTANDGAAGSADTTFGTGTAAKGNGGANGGGNGGAGGAATNGTGWTVIHAVTGGVGQGGANRGALTENLIGGSGGNNPMGGAGQGQQSAAGGAGAANTGAGGAGGSPGSALVGGGGGAGGYLEAIIPNPLPTYTYTVGAGGAGGSAGGAAGGDGGSGVIIVEEYYS
jgi:hypothetical protein